MIVYELGGLSDCRYSSFSWRTRMALAHLDLAADFRPVRVSDKAAIGFSGQGKVPILVDGDTAVYDSWRIAEHLDERHGSLGRTLFGGEVGLGLSKLINAWADRQVMPAAAHLIACDVVDIVNAEDAAHLRTGMEKGLGKTLEQIRSDRPDRVESFRRSLEPARTVLKAGQPFLSGQLPAYADYILFSIFQWARIASTFELLDEADAAMRAWRDRVLGLFDGYAAREPARGA